MVVDDWIDFVGGVKQAFALAADFSNFLFWDSVEHHCANHCIKVLTKTRLSDADRNELLNDVASLNRLFPDTIPLFSTAPEYLSDGWKSFKDRRRDKKKRYSEMCEHLPSIFGEPVDHDFFTKSIDLFSKACEEQKIRLGALCEFRDFMTLISGLKPKRCTLEEARYFSAIGIRRRCGSHLDGMTATSLQNQTDLLNEFISNRRKTSEMVYSQRRDIRLDSSVRIGAIELIRSLGLLLANPFIARTPNPEGNPGSGLLLSYLSVLGALRPPVDGRSKSSEDSRFYLRGDRVNSEYCLSMIFGFPIASTGIDTLFGGGGLFLYDERASRHGKRIALPGRIALIRGGFGSGKTSLSLSLAAANAQTGGLSVYFALESGFDNLWYSLQRLGFYGDNARFNVFCDFEEAYRYLRCRESNYKKQLLGERTESVDLTKGALVIIVVDRNVIKALPGPYLLSRIEKISKLRLEGITKMLLVDSLNALNRNFDQTNESEEGKQIDAVNKPQMAMDREDHNDESKPSTEIATQLANIANELARQNPEPKHSPSRRRNVLKSLQIAAENGTNIVLLSEEDDATWTSFGEDIADTVIKLGGPIETVRAGDAIFDQTFRTLNISKSRYQKEHPGTHPFKILPGEGLKAYCTTETRAVIDGWRSESHLPVAGFGVKAIDAILDSKGSNEPDCGRVICLEGKLGTYKTQFGMCFLKALKQEGKDAASLVISMRYDGVDIKEKLSDGFLAKAFDDDLKSSHDGIPLDEVMLCKLPHGNTLPDEIIRQIKDKFDEARKAGKRIRRVMLDNPGEWEDLCPMLQKDPLFASTLISFLRKRGARILVSNRLIAPSDSRLIRAILEHVETSIQLDSVKLGGRNVSTLRIVRSKKMTHEHQLFEIVVPNDDKGTLSLRPTESFSQFDSDGRVIPTQVRILTRKQSSYTKNYWKTTSALLQASIPSKVDFEESSSFGHRFAFGLASESTLDSLNILEIDEYELKDPKAVEMLAKIDLSEATGEYNSSFARSISNLPGDGHRRIVPFFANSSCLLFDENEIKICNADQVVDWQQILIEKKERAKRSIGKEAQRPFFAFPMSEPENWNSLFFEILANCEPELSREFSPNSLLELFSEENENKPRKSVSIASRIFHELTNDEYRRALSVGSLSDKREFDYSEPTAIVSRQWFTTLQETLRMMKKHENRISRDRNEAQDDKFSVSNYRIARLPGNWSVAGHWYLGILRDSVSIPAGVKFLKFLISREANEDRLRLGVGLPVYERNNYSPVNSTEKIWHCQDSLFFEQVPCNFIARSSFRDYLGNTIELTRLLQAIARLPVGSLDDSHLRSMWTKFIKHLASHPSNCEREISSNQ